MIAIWTYHFKTPTFPEKFSTIDLKFGRHTLE